MAIELKFIFSTDLVKHTPRTCVACNIILNVFCLTVLIVESHFQPIKYIHSDTHIKTVVILTVSHSLNVSLLQFLVSDSTKGLQVTLVH